jgi:hypothetical protein
MPEVRFALSISLLVVFFVGCDEQETKLRAWQQQQVDLLQRQSQENSTAARALVEADAQSRRQFVALEQAVQAERRQWADQYTALEADRKAVAAARERVPLLATALQGLATLALGIAALWVCGRLLGRMSSDDDVAQLEETLILSLAGETDLFTDEKVLLPRSPEVPVREQASPPIAAPALGND